MRILSENPEPKPLTGFEPPEESIEPLRVDQVFMDRIDDLQLSGEALYRTVMGHGKVAVEKGDDPIRTMERSMGYVVRLCELMDDSGERHSLIAAGENEKFLFFRFSPFQRDEE